MARFTIASALLAFASAVSAQTAGYHAITKPGMSEEVQAGSTYTITWTYAPAFPGNVVLALIGGATQNTQVPLYTIGSADGAAGQLSWKVDCAESGKAFYGLTITDASDSSKFQYSTPFKVVDSDACKSSSTIGSASTGSSATVTATLSSVSHSTTVHTNTTVTTDCTTSSAHIPTSVINYNSTMATSKTKGPEVVTSTAFSTAAQPSTTKAGATPSTVATSGATHVGSSIVMLAGVAAAFFVL